MADRAVLAREDVEGRNVRILRADVVAGVVAAGVGIELQVPPAALLLERNEPLDRRARDHREGDTLPDVACFAIPRAHQRRAHRAGAIALRPVHVAVEDERLLVAEQVGEADLAVLALEAVVAGDLAARRQLAALLGHPFDLPAKLDLLGQQRIARLPVVVALIGKMGLLPGRQLFGGAENS